MVEIGYDIYEYEMPDEFFYEWLTEEEQAEIMDEWEHTYKQLTKRDIVYVTGVRNFKHLSYDLNRQDYTFQEQLIELVDKSSNHFVVVEQDDGDTWWYMLYHLVGLDEKLENDMTREVIMDDLFEFLSVKNGYLPFNVETNEKIKAEYKKLIGGE